MAHERNIYKDDVDFAALALQSPEFNKFLKPNAQLDFSNPEAVKQLTKSLLKRDFGIEIELPDDRLCPPVPNRLNYILWIQDLLDTTSDSYMDEYNPEREVIGLDIGTGASCIFPLLGCAQRPKWRFAATDIDEKNMQYARQNIIANKLESRVRPLLIKPTDSMMPLDTLRLESIDFTICNPPFYASQKELLESAAAKSRPPNSACTGANVEMVTAGGEVAFVTRMIEESCKLKDRVQWYTTMLGKIGSVGTIVERLKERGVRNWAVKEFIQGTRTRRWGVAWSWEEMRPSMAIARGISALPKHLLPFPSEFHCSVLGASNANLSSKLNETLSALDLKWQFRASILTGLGFAKGNVWSRSARRKAEKKKAEVWSSKEEDAMDEDSEDEEPALGFKVKILPTEEVDRVAVTAVEVRWLKGNDQVLFESFCGMIQTQLQGTAARNVINFRKQLGD